MRLTLGCPLSGFINITLNGEDVTPNCQEAATRLDIAPGYVVLLVRDKFDIRDWSTAQERKSGDVQITLRDDAPEWARNMYQSYLDCDKWMLGEGE